MEAVGFAFVAGRREGEASLPEYYGTAFHGIDYIRREWTRRFRIRAWLPGLALGYQDLLVLERG